MSIVLNSSRDDDQHSSLSAPSNTLFALVQSKLKEESQAAIEKGRNLSDGFTLDISHQSINYFAPEVVPLIKDIVERLAISHNQISSFPEDFGSCLRLRYLNVKSNQLREFPAVLCQLEALEILDISRNRLRSFPDDFGHLSKLKILSISKNKIQTLPHYIGHMDELKVLKLDHNPITYPPEDVIGYGTFEAERDGWIDDLKRYLREHAEKPNIVDDIEDSGSSTDGGTDTDYSFRSRDLSRRNSVEGLQNLYPHSDTEDSEYQPSEASTAPPVPSKNTQRLGPGILLPKESSYFPNAANVAANAERSRSNSESTVNRAAKRMGIIGEKNGLGVVPETRTAKHSRGISYDSSMNDANNRKSALQGVDGTSSFSNADVTRHFDPYVWRLSASLSSNMGKEELGHLADMARALLYTAFQIQPAIYTFAVVSKMMDVTIGFDRVLSSVNQTIAVLMQLLDSDKSKDQSLSVESLIAASLTCATSFKLMVNQLQEHLQYMKDEVKTRYTRPLLLTVFGAMMELLESWQDFRSTMLDIISQDGDSAGDVKYKPEVDLSDSYSSTLASLMSPTYSKVGDYMMIPPTPSISILDNPFQGPDEALFSKLSSTLISTLSVIQLFLESIKKAIHTHTEGSQHSGQSRTIGKLQELNRTCLNGAEIVKRLKIGLETIREADNTERRRFAEDITRFVTSVMSIGELARAGANEFQFQKHVLSSFAPIARSTKEVTVLLHVSSFRALNDSTHQASHHNNNNNHQQVFSPALYSSSLMFGLNSPQPQSAVTTPLSAALGAAAQATVPLTQQQILHQPSSSMSTIGYSLSRTNTGLNEQ